MKEFGKYLREVRGNRSLRDVQKGTGISHTYLSTLEKGYDPRTKKERMPSPEILKKLAKFYDVTYISLMEKAGYLKKSPEEGQAILKDKLKDILKNPGFNHLTDEEKEEFINQFVAYTASKKHNLPTWKKDDK